MTDHAALARAVARRLAAAHPELPLEVEKRLAGPGGGGQFGPMGDAASLATALVAAAGLAWMIYNESGPDIDSESLARRVRIELREQGMPPEQIDSVIDIVVDEAIKAGG